MTKAGCPIKGCEKKPTTIMAQTVNPNAAVLVCDEHVSTVHETWRRGQALTE